MNQLEDTLMQIYSAEPQAAMIEMQEGGEVSQEQMLMQALEGEAEAMADPNEALRSSIEELMMQASMTDDPTERDQYLHLAEAAEIGSQAPMGDMAVQLAQAGRGEDSALAHVRPGEVILPPEAFEDPRFEEIVEAKFKELDLDPEQMVVGVGIASLNPITGLEEFGFFKKLAKGVKKVVKKVVKPIAKVAQFIPGPWQPIAALANKAFTVYDVAKGRANPLSLLTVAGPGATGGSFGQNIADITKAGGGSFFSGLGKGLMASGSGVTSGIGSLFKNPIGTFTGSAPGGGIPGLLKSATMSGQAKLTDAEIVDQLRLTASPDISATIEMMQTQGIAPGEILKSVGVSPASFFNPAGFGDAKNPLDVIKNYVSSSPTSQAEIDAMLQQGMTPEQISAQILGGQQGGSFFGMKTPDFIKQLGDPLGFGGASGLRDAYGGGAGGGGLLGGGGLGGLAAAGIPALLLAKMAMDEAKKDKGVQLTPAMTMSRYGGYELAALDAARQGQEAPDPRQFGMLAPGTIPMLSGGRKPTTEQAKLEEQKQGMRYGGSVQPMYFNEGGNVDAEVFVRMNGDIEGPGTEISDDIPAMLSDGEFVMTGRAVRGAGGFDLNKDADGIITLIKNGDESREKGTELMYKMMDLFEEFAGAPAKQRAR